MLESIDCSYCPEAMFLRIVVNGLSEFTVQEIFVEFEENNTLVNI
jgi:hypothetical protein